METKDKRLVEFGFVEREKLDINGFLDMINAAKNTKDFETIQYISFRKNDDNIIIHLTNYNNETLFEEVIYQ